MAGAGPNSHSRSVPHVIDRRELTRPNKDGAWALLLRDGVDSRSIAWVRQRFARGSSIDVVLELQSVVVCSEPQRMTHAPGRLRRRRLTAWGLRAPLEVLS